MLVVTQPSKWIEDVDDLVLFDVSVDLVGEAEGPIDHAVHELHDFMPDRFLGVVLRFWEVFGVERLEVVDGLLDFLGEVEEFAPETFIALLFGGTELWLDSSDGVAGVGIHDWRYVLKC